jgi:hypothetical protein
MALLCVVLVVSAYGAFEEEYAPGKIETQGYDYQTAVYENVYDSYRYLEAASVRMNPDISAQMIIVGPANRGLGTVTGDNIESGCRAYLEAIGLIDQRFDLNLIKKKFILDKTWVLVFRRTLDGLPVLDGGVKMAVGPGGNINLIMGNFSDAPDDNPVFTLSESAATDLALVGLHGSVVGAEVKERAIMPLFFKDRTEYHPVYRVEVMMDDPYSEWYVFVDGANGTILQRKSSVYYGTVHGNVSGSIQPLTPFDPWEDRDFYHLNVIFGAYGPALTDMDGDYTITIPNNDPLDVEAWLQGPFMSVNMGRFQLTPR